MFYTRNLLSLWLLLGLCSCKNLDFKNPTMVSLSIEESKEIGVFIREYRIKDVKVLDSSYQFPFSQVWEEMAWHLELDEQREKKVVLDTASISMVIFNSTSKDTLLTNGNLLKKWVVKTPDTHSVGSIRGVPNLSSSDFKNDTTAMTIYTLVKEYGGCFDEQNLVPIFEFSLIR